MTVSLTPIPTMEPVPRVEFKFGAGDLLQGTERATVYRITGTKSSRVRGAIAVYAAGGFAGVDTEAPFNTTVSYRAELFNAAGTRLGYTTAVETLLPFDGSVVHQPLDPTRAAAVDLRPSFGSEISRPFIGDVVYPIGRSVGVYIGTGRRGVTDVDLTVITDTLDAADAFLSVFGDEDLPQLPVVCVRTQPQWRLPMPLFAAVMDPREQRFDTDLGGETIDWRMSGDQVAPPAEAIALALLTYADFEEAFATYRDFENAYLTYFDAESDFDLSETAPPDVVTLVNTPPGSSSYSPTGLTPVSETAYSPAGLASAGDSGTGFNP